MERVLAHSRDFRFKNREYRARLLYRAMNKHGPDLFSFQIICTAESPEDLSLKEKLWIDIFNSRDPRRGYNIAAGGDGGDTYSSMSEEDKKKRDAKVSQAGRASYTQERKNKSSVRLKQMRSIPQKCAKNKKVCSERMKRLNKDPSFIAKMNRKRQIKCDETGEIFDSVSALAQRLSAELGIRESTAKTYLYERNFKIGDKTYTKIPKETKGKTV